MSLARKRIRSRSPRTVAEAPLRTEVVDAAMRRDNGECQLKGYGRCWGPLDPHEVLRRSAMRGVHLDLKFVVILCRGHHGIDSTDPKLAERLGIRVVRWAWDQHGEATLTEARRLRSLARRGSIPRPPFWRVLE